MIARFYYECHVTVEPIFDKKLDKFDVICKRHLFHPAKLLMQKRKEDTAERSSKDAFCTARAKSYHDLLRRMLELVAALKEADIKVWRYKIEDTLLDSKIEDEMELLA